MTSPPFDTAASDGGDAAARTLDDAIWRRQTDTWAGLSVVRVYVYEMPAKFTYDLLRLFRNTFPDTANLTSNGSPVHRLIEQVGEFNLFSLFVFAPFHVFVL